MAILPGWQRLGGKAERYRDPAGREVSRRQYENARSQLAGWESWSEYQRTRKSPDYQRAVEDAIDAGHISRRQIGPTAELSRLYLRARKARTDKHADLYDPDGPLAEYLIYIGRRQPDDWWDVGDTPGTAGK